jgi:ubiquinone/menaquinone biosynthesis C-methylase UbiE
MRFTGERVIPDLPELRATFLQSKAVYRFASERVAGKRVLDVGAGEGYGPALLADHARAVVALDSSSEAVQHAARRYGDSERIAFVAGDAGALPFSDRRFDVVCCFQVIEHLPDAASFLFEVSRVLRPAGEFLLTTPNRLFAGTAPNPHHIQEYSADELNEILEIVFPHVEMQGVFGSPRVMQYRASNRRIVRYLLYLDFMGLRYRLPEWIREPIHARMTRLIRGYLRRRNPRAVDDLTLDDFSIRDEDVDHSIDLLAIARTREADAGQA